LAVAAVTNIILNIILIPLLGILGAAIATLITFFLLAALTLCLSFKELRFDLNFVFIVKSAIASMIMSGLILKYNPVGTVNVLISIGFGGVIYFGLIWLMKGLNKDELRVLKDSFR
jgi:O-antigen/teichoic acid export membrane protein